MKRSYRTNLAIQFFAISVICGSLNAQTNNRPPMCFPGLIVDCDRNYEEIVWATDSAEQQCRVLKNRCIFNNIQCHNFNNRKPLLKESTKENCQKLCANYCNNASMESVCAERGGKYCMFKDKCTLEKHMCKQGESWTIELVRFCTEQSSSTGNNCPNGLA